VLTGIGGSPEHGAVPVRRGHHAPPRIKEPEGPALTGHPRLLALPVPASIERAEDDNEGLPVTTPPTVADRNWTCCTAIAGPGGAALTVAAAAGAVSRPARA